MPTLPQVTTGPERPMLEHMLDRNRRALIDTARGLSEVDVRRRLVVSLTTPIGLIIFARHAGHGDILREQITAARQASASP